MSSIISLLVGSALSLLMPDWLSKLWGLRLCTTQALGGGAVQPFSAAAPLSEMVTPGSTAYLGLLRHTFTPEWAETRAEGRETMLKDGE